MWNLIVLTIENSNDPLAAVNLTNEKVCAPCTDTVTLPVRHHVYIHDTNFKLTGLLTQTRLTLSFRRTSTI